MRDKRYANAPLLYIHQPSTAKIDAKMQHNYVGKRTSEPEKTPEAKEKRETIKRHPSRQRKGRFYGSTASEEESAQEEAEEKQEKPFKELELEEKIHYILNRPSFAPRLVSEVRTEERVYRGILLDYKEGILTIRSGKRQLEVPFEQVKQIRLLSL